MKALRLLILFLSGAALSLSAQNIIPQQDPTRAQHHFASDSVEVEDVPEGIYAWHIHPRFGNIQRVPFDTVPHLFPNESYTDGVYGHYNYLGNVGSPRISRLFSDRDFSSFNQGQFIFSRPYSFFLNEPGDIYFTNTRSPFTNLTYHESGNKTNGEDHFRAIFAVNVNKNWGWGFKFDYIYGRGYYDSQSTSQFNGMLYTSYLSDHYHLHAYYSANHLKTRENGGIQDDNYITHPENFSTSYSTQDIPIRLQKSFNKLHFNTFYLTHRYNLGFTRYRDKEHHIVKIQKDKHGKTLAALATTDSIAQDSTTTAQTDSAFTPQMLAAEFVPVTAFIHTMRIDQNNRYFLNNSGEADAKGYFKNIFLPTDYNKDNTNYLHVGNLLGLEISEGFNKWMKTGMRLFAVYDFFRYTLPEKPTEAQPNLVPIGKYHDNYVSAGVQLFKHQGRFFRYDVLGELRSNGQNWGEFNAEGHLDFDIPFRKDSLSVRLSGYVRNEQPSFYLRHFHSQNTWWDNALDNTFSIRAGGYMTYRRTKFSLYVENIRKLAYLETLTTDKGQHDVHVRQDNGMLQLLSASARQDFRWGIFNWENELTFQTSTDQKAYPLPAVNIWSNVYLKFNIAKVLHTELGADVRFFTPYYAPTYVPQVGLFAVQGSTLSSGDAPAKDSRVKLGNYPIVNAYVNFQLKRTRFYVSATHVNYAKGSGNPFLVPHYPLNQMIIRFGVSWNFIN